MPCPNGVNIPGIFSLWNDKSLYNIETARDFRWKKLTADNAGADHCVGCGACEAACPQHLPIIESLQAAWSELR